MLNEYQELKGWGRVHFLKAKITKDEFDKIQRKLGYIQASENDKNYVIWPLGISIQWWDPYINIDDNDLTFYDSTTNTSHQRKIKYKRGYFYYCEYYRD